MSSSDRADPRRLRTLEREVRNGGAGPGEKINYWRLIEALETESCTDPDCEVCKCL
jgi:hypothetical protein